MARLAAVGTDVMRRQHGVGTLAGVSGVVESKPGFMAALRPETRSTLFQRGVQRTHPAGRVVWDVGQSGRYLAVVLDGRAKVSVTTRSGTEVLVDIISPGELLGEVSIMSGRTRSARVTAIDRVRVLTVPAAEFLDLLDHHADMQRALLRTLAERVSNGHREWEKLDDDIETRVARQLLLLAQRFGSSGDDGAVHIDLPLTQEEIAGLVWSTRGSVAAALRTLRDDDVVHTARRRITITDLDKLRQRLS